MNTTDHPPPPPPPSSTTGTPANRAGPSYPPHGGSAVTPITHASSSSFQEEDQKIRSQNNREYSPWDGYMGGNRSESNDSQQYRDQEEKNTAYGYRKNPHYPSRGYEAPAPYPYSNDSFDHGAQYVQRRQESFPYPPSTGGPHYRHGFDEARAEVPYQYDAPQHQHQHQHHYDYNHNYPYNHNHNQYHRHDYENQGSDNGPVKLPYRPRGNQSYQYDDQKIPSFDYPQNEGFVPMVSPQRRGNHSYPPPNHRREHSTDFVNYPFGAHEAPRNNGRYPYPPSSPLRHPKQTGYHQPRTVPIALSNSFESPDYTQPHYPIPQASSTVPAASDNEPTCFSVSEINCNDVLCGRGGGTNSQIGNRQFRKLVNEFQPEYLHARRKQKPLIAKRIVQIIRQRGGRFLRKNDSDGYYFEVGDFKAEAKTSQALREGLDVRAESKKREREKLLVNQAPAPGMGPNEPPPGEELHAQMMPVNDDNPVPSMENKVDDNEGPSWKKIKIEKKAPMTEEDREKWSEFAPPRANLYKEDETDEKESKEENEENIEVAKSDELKDNEEKEDTVETENNMSKKEDEKNVDEEK